MSGPDPALAGAYEQCRRIQAEHGRSFYRATCLLPRARRRHVWALYALARVTDNIVDTVPVGEDTRGQDLITWREHACATLGAAAPPCPLTDPVLTATWHTLAELNLSTRLLEEFFDSMALDLHVTRYQTWGDLRRYMRGSAAVIGELMAPVLSAPSYATPYAALLGEAFQLTNFVRDVAEDLRLGRIYLPIEDLTACDVTPADLQVCVADGVPTPAVRRLLAFEIDRARGLYAAAAPGVPMLPGLVRPCIRSAIALYSGILTEIERTDYNVFAGRVVVPAARRTTGVLRALSGVPDHPLGSTR
ncbi:phytoene/squalene synthase family protein [Leekyejoonella antrihumi]|uniref:Phytoene/squalene synthase family protein n=1 Tax=Leekyejoonella antrihumi TaxID=1660198 RepID=A0A563E426_9MICO|nr:phytoene/squalene synthase family protein [Leekyejoonella antrihumi]TWP36961.1 phytoene/squalene synthase family protein [Leekyejoonella antrihumi]